MGAVERFTAGSRLMTRNAQGTTMRHMLLSTLAVVGLATAVHAQPAPQPPNTPTGARPGNEIGTNNSLPTSDRASNITRSTSRSTIAPRLPAPGLSGDTPTQLLTAAKNALRRNRTGEAQEALERAETRLLDRSTEQGANPLDTSPIVKQIGDAREAIASGDRARATSTIDSAMASIQSMPVSSGSAGSSM